MKYVFIFLAFFAVSTASAQDTTVTVSKLFNVITMTTALDTVDYIFKSDLGIEAWNLTAYNATGADTLNAFFQEQNDSTWVPCGGKSFSSGSSVATFPTSTTVGSWQLHKTNDKKVRIISTSNDGSSTIVIVAATKRDQF